MIMTKKTFNDNFYMWNEPQIGAFFLHINKEKFNLYVLKNLRIFVKIGKKKDRINTHFTNDFTWLLLII